MTSILRQLLAVEAELTDDYVRGDLVGMRRERFERQLLNTAEGRYDVEFARTITATPGTCSATRRSVIDRDRSDWRLAFAWLTFFDGRAFQVSFAALALVLVGLGLWLIWSSRRHAYAGSKRCETVHPPILNLKSRHNLQINPRRLARRRESTRRLRHLNVLRNATHAMETRHQRTKPRQSFP